MILSSWIDIKPGDFAIWLEKPDRHGIRGPLQRGGAALKAKQNFLILTAPKTAHDVNKEYQFGNWIEFTVLVNGRIKQYVRDLDSDHDSPNHINKMNIVRNI